MLETQLPLFTKKEEKEFLTIEKENSVSNQGEQWREEWVGMPEFFQEDQTSFRSLRIHFSCQEDVDAFAKLIGQNITIRQKALWYPEHAIKHYANKRYFDEP